MIDEIRKIKSGPKELKEFGITFAVVFGALTGLIYWRHHALNLNFAAAAVLFAFLAFVYPQVLVPLQKVWMTLALLMGWVMSRVILGILFFAVITPIAIFLRLTGKRFMELKIDKSAKSYWHPRPDVPFDKASCETQY
jgi:hypothetical protein